MSDDDVCVRLKERKKKIATVPTVKPPRKTLVDVRFRGRAGTDKTIGTCAVCNIVREMTDEFYKPEFDRDRKLYL